MTETQNDESADVAGGRVVGGGCSGAAPETQLASASARDSKSTERVMIPQWSGWKGHGLLAIIITRGRVAALLAYDNASALHARARNSHIPFVIDRYGSVLVHALLILAMLFAMHFPWQVLSPLLQFPVGGGDDYELLGYDDAPWPFDHHPNWSFAYNPSAPDGNTVALRVRKPPRKEHWDTSSVSTVLLFERRASGAAWHQRLEILRAQDARAVRVGADLLLTHSSFDETNQRIFIAVHNCSKGDAARVHPHQHVRLMPPPLEQGEDPLPDKEKNWLPFVAPASGALHFVRHVEPHEVLHCDHAGTKQCHVIYRSASPHLWPKATKLPHGGAPPVLLHERSTFVAVANVQQELFPGDRKLVYLHVLYTFSAAPPFAVQSVSSPFRLRDLTEPNSRLEFVSGMYRENRTHLAITYGFRDAKSRRAWLPIETALRRARCTGSHAHADCGRDR